MNNCCDPADRAPDKKYDLVVVGGGSAGFSAAITAAEQGAHVAVIGDGTIGGPCVHVGCVPSKAIIRSVESIHPPTAAPKRFHGIRAPAAHDDLHQLSAQTGQASNE